MVPFKLVNQYVYWIGSHVQSDEERTVQIDREAKNQILRAHSHEPELFTWKEL